MEVIPAVDIRNGKCVRLLQGKFDQETVFCDDPVEMALKWESQGAPRLHVVDLDGAKTGRPHNLEIIRRIASALSVPVQMGGGVRSILIATRVLGLGVERVVIGTSAFLDQDWARMMFEEFGDRVVLGLDAHEGLVATHGWQETGEIGAIDFAKEMEALGARRIIHTDISRDGMLEGVNLPAMEAMARAVSIPVIASGGVTSIEDIRNLKRLEPLGIEGVIVGKALYTGSLDLREAIKVAGA